LDNNLIVLKKRSMWLVDCNPQVAPVEFPVRPVHQRIGTSAPMTWVQIGSDVWGLSDSGVRSIKRTLAAEAQQETSDALSTPVQDIINRINGNALDRACATYWNNRYILSVPLDGSTLNNYTLVYNFLTESWHGTWAKGSPPFPNITSPAAYIRNVYPGSSHLMWAADTGTTWPTASIGLYEWQDYVSVIDETNAVYQDGVVGIPITILSRAVTFRDVVSPKTGVDVELEFDQSPIGAIATITAIGGSGTTLVLGTIDTSTGVVTPTGQPPYTLTGAVLRPAFDLMVFGQFRELQIKVTTDPNGLPIGVPHYSKLILRSIVFSGFIETLRLQPYEAAT
jgi:hypothetical protein